MKIELTIVGFFFPTIIRKDFREHDEDVINSLDFHANKE